MSVFPKSVFKYSTFSCIWSVLNLIWIFYIQKKERNWFRLTPQKIIFSSTEMKWNEQNKLRCWKSKPPLMDELGKGKWLQRMCTVTALARDKRLHDSSKNWKGKMAPTDLLEKGKERKWTRRHTSPWEMCWWETTERHEVDGKFRAPPAVRNLTPPFLPTMRRKRERGRGKKAGKKNTT